MNITRIEVQMSLIEEALSEKSINIVSQIKFSLKEIQSLNPALDKKWFYKNCIPIGTRVLFGGVENIYAVGNVRNVLIKKHDELKKNYLLNDKQREKTERKLNKIEKAIAKLIE